MHTDSMPPETQADLIEVVGPAPAPRTNNTLKLLDRVNLMQWMEIPENRDYIAKESDALAAGKATGDLKFDVTPANIGSIRKTLGIEKYKAPAPARAPDIDLVALAAKVAQHGIQLDPIADFNIPHLLTNLSAYLNLLVKRIDIIDGGCFSDQGIIADLRLRLEALESANN